MVTMAMLPKLICSFSAILVRIPADFFAETDKWLLRLMENQGTQNSQNYPEKE
jgi:hypothetical protein